MKDSLEEAAERFALGIIKEDYKEIRYGQSIGSYSYILFYDWFFNNYGYNNKLRCRFMV